MLTVRSAREIPRIGHVYKVQTTSMKLCLCVCWGEEGEGCKGGGGEGGGEECKGEGEREEGKGAKGE